MMHFVSYSESLPDRYREKLARAELSHAEQKYVSKEQKYVNKSPRVMPPARVFVERVGHSTLNPG